MRGKRGLKLLILKEQSLRKNKNASDGSEAQLCTGITIADC
jgi:hypothetical protein